MKSMILCAGLGTRLRPWTLHHPKALVPVGGVPMLKKVIESLADQGFDDFTVNVHHFASQIMEYVKNDLSKYSIHISDESDHLLETGGAILHADEILTCDSHPFLVHNVDILSNADLKSLYDFHCQTGSDITLLVSDRDSSRKLIFNPDMTLKGWINKSTKETRPALLDKSPLDREYAFSGIYVVSVNVLEAMRKAGFDGAFPIMDFLLDPNCGVVIKGMVQNGLQIIDIGKPETLLAANQ